MNALINFPAAPTISVSWRYVVQLWTSQIKPKMRTEMKKVHLAIMQIHHQCFVSYLLMKILCLMSINVCVICIFHS